MVSLHPRKAQYSGVSVSSRLPPLRREAWAGSGQRNALEIANITYRQGPLLAIRLSVVNPQPFHTHFLIS